ncbi:MAG TPA: 6-hydroxymethylpterin diphosphokinase MptE-like protein, partial [Waddliaceae bacterium]
MESSEQFSKNVARWALTSPKEAELILKKGSLKVEFCTTGSKDLNLKREEEGETYYYHSTQNALKEAEQWFSSLDLYNISTLFVYGVGLGYYYQAAKEWLRANRARHLVFIEDDSDVIVQLFQMELGTELLHDPQVTLLLIGLSRDEEPQDVEKRLFSLPYTLLLGNIRLSALNLYSQIHEPHVFLLNLQLEYLKNVKIYQVMEYMRFGEAFFHNFYRNLLELPKAYLGDKLYGKFEGVPAIICGAGPSLDKNLPLLKELEDRALIFAGGSAMNAINTFGILPHFGVGVDPNLGQYVRLMMNQAYEVPFFYRNRIFPEALQSLHGPRLFILGAGGYPISKWIEEQFGVSESR